MMDSVEDSNGQSEESDDESNNCATGLDDTCDWETVPSLPPHPGSATSQTALGYVSQDMTDSALTASGVLSSAFNTFSSYFRR